MPSLSRVGLVGLALVGSGLCTGAEITVRVINAENGRPWPNEIIWLYLGKTLNPAQRGTTGQDGTVSFHVADPLPITFAAYPSTAMRGVCSKTQFSTKEVLHHGVVQENLRDKRHRLELKIRATPGEAVIFRKYPRWWDYW